MTNRMKTEFERKDLTEEVRLNKYLSESGCCSRREADRLIAEGKVTVDGMTAVMGMKVRPAQEVKIGKKPVCREEKMVLIAVNKPMGIVCTAEKKEKNNIVDYLSYPQRIYPVGRLDKDSEGLLLMTNNGDIVNKMMRSGNRHEKEYLVTVDRPVTDPFLQKMRSGVPVLGVTTRECEAEQLGKYKFRIVLTQGLNRQIRRMCEYLGYKVKKLERIRIMNIRLGHLASGGWRHVTEAEAEGLYSLLKDSSNNTVYEEEK